MTYYNKGRVTRIVVQDWVRVLVERMWKGALLLSHKSNFKKWPCIWPRSFLLCFLCFSFEAFFAWCLLFSCQKGISLKSLCLSQTNTSVTIAILFYNLSNFLRSLRRLRAQRSYVSTALFLRFTLSPSSGSDSQMVVWFVWDHLKGWQRVEARRMGITHRQKLEVNGKWKTLKGLPRPCSLSTTCHFNRWPKWCFIPTKVCTSIRQREKNCWLPTTFPFCHSVKNWMAEML